MWGKIGQTRCGTQIDFINTAGLRGMNCGAKASLDPLWDLDKF